MLIKIMCYDGKIDEKELKFLRLMYQNSDLLGHGGLFKTPGVAQRYLAAAAGAPVTCMETAGEGGPYGMALLAAYRLHRAEGETLADYLKTRVFAEARSTTVTPDAADVAGFAAFLREYERALKPSGNKRFSRKCFHTFSTSTMASSTNEPMAMEMLSANICP